MKYEAVQMRGGARTGLIRHAVLERDRWMTLCGRPARRADDEAEDFLLSQVQCRKCLASVKVLEMQERDEKLRAEAEALAGLWLILFGTRVEVVLADDADTARTKWLDANYPYRGDEGDPARGRFAPPLVTEVGVRALTQKDVDLFTSWQPAFPKRIAALQKARKR